MNTKTNLFNHCMQELPLIAILRGVLNEEVQELALCLYAEGFRMIEVPLNSPNAMESIRLLAQCLPSDCLFGAGTVTQQSQIQELAQIGANLLVMPHTDVELIHAAKEANMVCIPGACTPSEVFACHRAGADAVKLYPAEMIRPSVVHALRAVLPKKLKLLPVGGVSPLNMSEYVQAGANGFGLGGNLYKPGLTSALIRERARVMIGAWKSATNLLT